MVSPAKTSFMVPHYPVDKILKTLTGNVSLPQNTFRGTGAGLMTLTHGLGQNVFPLVSYSLDGTKWFSNGQYEMYYNGTIAAYEPRVFGKGYADTSGVYIEWQTGSATGTLTVQYRIRLVALI